MNFDNFKVVTESILVAGRFAWQLRMVEDEPLMDGKEGNIKKLFELVLKFLQKGDLDQYAKQISVTSMGNILEVAYPKFKQNEIDMVLTIF